MILAGRPSMGKTALATNIAFNAAKAYREERDEPAAVKVLEGAKVAFFSLEMSAEQLATRILAEQTGISSDRIRRGEVREEDFPKFVAAAQQLTRLPFFIDDTPGLLGAGAAHARAAAEAPARPRPHRRRLSAADPLGRRAAAARTACRSSRRSPAA